MASIVHDSEHDSGAITPRAYGVGRVFRRRGSPFWWISYYVEGQEHRESTKTRSRMEAEHYLEMRRRDPGIAIFAPGSDEGRTVARALDAICRFRDRADNGAVYFVKPEEFEFVKIGYESRPSSRLYALQTAWPVELKVLLRIAAPIHLESDLHSIFRQYHRRGDWFDYNDVFEVFIQRAQREVLAQKESALKRARESMGAPAIS